MKTIEDVISGEELINNIEIPDITTFIDSGKYNNISQALLDEIEENKKTMELCGNALINQCNKLGFTSKRSQFGYYCALSYALDIKVKGVLSYREKYIDAKKNYLRLASRLNTIKGWLSLVELNMLERPEDITKELFTNWLDVNKTFEEG